MSIAEFLYTEAIKKIWINPHGDRNAIFRMVRLTRPQGTVNTLVLPYDNIELPMAGKRYVIFELGGVDPEKIGIDLTGPMLGWIPIAYLSSTMQVFITIFCQGRMASLDGCYFQITDNKNIIIALDYSINLPVLILNDTIYIRFYSNIYYETGTNVNKQVLTGTFLNDTGFSSYISFANLISSITAFIGVNPFLYLNGLYLPDGLPPHTALSISDRIDYTFDPLIIIRDIVKIDEMDSFTSTIDATNKVIASVELITNNVYVDDMEFYITGIRPDGLRVGVYFPRLSPSSIRQLTYVDWSLNALNVNGRLEELRMMVDSNGIITDTKLYIFRRDNGEPKQLPLDSNRIADLLNVPTAIRKELLTGVNSNLSLWLASTLEDCPFNRWMSLENVSMLTNIHNVYSRQAAIAELERVRILPGNTDWSLPAISSNGGGILITHNTDGSGVIPITYSAISHLTDTYVNGKGYEMFYPGHKQTDPLDLLVNAGDSSDTVIEDTFGVLIYYDNGIALVTATYGIDYTLTNINDTTVIHWGPAVCYFDRYIRTSQKIVYFTVSITLAEIIQGIDLYNGRSMLHDVGMESLSVWYNDRYLIEGLDYYIMNGLIFMVSINTYWTDPGTLTVIYAGLPDLSLKHVAKGEWGFIKYGMITNNSVYDLYAYRNKLFYVDGAAIHINEIVEAEHYANIPSVMAARPLIDGTPYAIIDAVQFSRNEELDLIVPTAITEKLTDAAISNLLSVLDKQVPLTGIITIASKYDLVSPIMNQVIEDIANGVLVIDRPSYTDIELSLKLTPYLGLINIDPTLKNHDLDFVEIHPRWSSIPVSVNIMEYNFINRVNIYALNGQLHGLNLYLNIV